MSNCTLQEGLHVFHQEACSNGGVCSWLKQVLRKTKGNAGLEFEKEFLRSLAYLTNTCVAEKHYLRLQLRRSGCVCFLHIITSHLLSSRCGVLIYLKPVKSKNLTKTSCESQWVRPTQCKGFHCTQMRLVLFNIEFIVAIGIPPREDLLSFLTFGKSLFVYVGFYIEVTK